MSPGPRYLPEWLDYTQEPREIHGSTFVFCASQLCQGRVVILKALALSCPWMFREAQWGQKSETIPRDWEGIGALPGLQQGPPL